MSKNRQLFLFSKTISVDSRHLFVHDYIRIVIFSSVFVEL